MSVYHANDWDAASATMAPSAAEVAQEKAYWAEVDRQESYADYLAHRAEEQLLEDAEQDVRAEASRYERRGPDGLTKAERLSLYSPANYTVEKVGPIQFVATNENGAEFTVSVIYGR